MGDNSGITVRSAGRLFELPSGATAADLARAGGKSWARAVAASVEGAPRDLAHVLSDGDEVEPVPAGSEEGRHVLRHSTAHVLAQAVLDLWPGSHFAIGPPIEDGFYYDFELPGGERFVEEDLVRIEARMREIVAEGQPFVREEHDVASGTALFEGQPFKLEIIRAAAGGDGSGAGLDGEVAPAGVVSVYRNRDDFADLCRGPHVPSTAVLGHFKLLRVAGAYWRGDEKRPQLQRIYGTAWESKSALAEHLQRLAEAEARDHRRLGVELDLFHFPPEIGSGLPVFHPRGGMLRYLMEEFSRKAHLAAGYELVWTPHPSRATLFETSGHLEWYAEGMYPPMEMEGATYYLKPMNCPMHTLIYGSRSRSYRELPLRLFELGTVYRFERSGVLHGLARVRGLTQDDSHIFCSPDQLAEELARLLRFVLAMLRAFGLSDFQAELATRNPEKFVGEVSEWEFATDALRHALETAGLDYVVGEAEASFYAPKIDVHLRDAIGRRWQVSTLQVDLQLPQRFDLSYVGSDNAHHRPYMIHRALFGSVERFMALLIEHHAGALPTWLSPVQVRVLAVSSDQEAYAASVVDRLSTSGWRADTASADETLGARVRRAKMEKLPWILVVGGEDVAAGTVGVNARGSARPERGVSLEAFLATLETDGKPPVVAA
ncbi:MAG: threonine--tRNA ligase [Actinomycetota bacterium]|nr:threonine--tRNA ligase [Actinomycetota bacterium]